VPLSVILALALVSQGVVQTFSPYAKATVVQPSEYDEPVTDKDGKPVLDEKGQPTTKKPPLTEQVIAVGPAASQIAIKQLGTNGGGFFNANSAHPFENPTPLSNFLEMLSILLIAAALCYTFGVMVGDVRQGWTVLASMTVIFVSLLVVCYVAEQNGAVFVKQGVDHAASALQSGGNMEGKEVRFGIASSAIWATATTSASNGSVNSMHDSYTPLGGLVPMWMIQLGEVVYGGVGSGLYGMLMFAIVAVFVAGLMVGRTPEYLGKKIEAYEMKMASRRPGAGDAGPIRGALAERSASRRPAPGLEGRVRPGWPRAPRRVGARAGGGARGRGGAPGAADAARRGHALRGGRREPALRSEGPAAARGRRPADAPDRAGRPVARPVGGQ
jgi:K+-transporting ATPase ATPase A chain